jgi:uncharacterized protein YkwD
LVKLDLNWQFYAFSTENYKIQSTIEDNLYTRYVITQNTPMKTFLIFLSFALLAFMPAPKQAITTATICLNTEEKKLYDLIMNYRKQKKLPAIPLSGKITMVAQVHAKDLSEQYNANDEKCNLHSWSAKGKWTSCCYTDDHKKAQCMWDKPREIAGYESNGFEISYYSGGGATAEEGLAGWKVSNGHNQVIINEGIWKNMKWNAIGIGIYKEYGVVWFGDLADAEKPVECK